MKDFIEKLIIRLEEMAKLYRRKEEIMSLNPCYQKGVYGFKATGYESSILIVNELAEEYMTCYKSCTECEAYDREKHHCPKFCYIIEETVKEIEKNHKGGWIPVSERLPEIDGMYLTTVFDKSTNRRMLRHRKFEKGRFIEGGTSRAFPIIAWYSCSLPEPYKGE